MALNHDKLFEARTDIIAELHHCCTQAVKVNEATDIELVSTRKDVLAETYARFVSIKTEMQTGLDNWDDETRTALRSANHAMTDGYITAMAHLKQLLHRVEPAIPIVLQPNAGDQVVHQHKSKFKLPAIKIKTFASDFSEWEEFKDVFEACVASEASKFSNCEKLLYLKGSLNGEAYNLVKNLRTTNDNYQVAWNLLENRYQNARKIFNAHIDAILNLPTMKTESASNVKQLLDTTNASLSALKARDLELRGEENMLVRILELKLDKESRKHWAEHLKGSTRVPSYQQFEAFLKLRVNILEGIESSPEKSHHENTTTKEPTVEKVVTHTKKEKGKSQALTPGERVKLIHNKNLCKNCFYPHKTEKCKSRFACSVCGERPNSLLHEAGEASFSSHLKCKAKTLLATAIVPVIDKFGFALHVKALLDPGSTHTLISERIAQRLKLPRRQISRTITSVDDSTASIAKGTMSVTFGSCIDKNYTQCVDALIVRTITQIRPPHSIDNVANWQHIHGLELADPTHMNDSKIDLLLGADVYGEIVLNGLKKGQPGAPIAQHSKLGWILFGKVDSSVPDEQVLCNFTQTNTDLTHQLHKFWELEEIVEKKMFTTEEQEIENRFVKETKIGPDGKFIVRLPFRIPPNEPNFIGSSYN